MAQNQRGKSPVVIALIGAIASVATAFVTSAYKAQPAASDALNERAGTVGLLTKQVADLSGTVDQVKNTVGGFRPAPIGTVIASMLSPAQMARGATGEWVPADGRNRLPIWEYSKLTGEPKLPDLRGMFLRGVNDSDDGKRTDGSQDPDSDRKVGSLQAYAIGAHQHPLYMKAVGFNQGREGSFASNIFTEGNLATEVDDAVRAPKNTPKESRPSNVAIHWYIKVN